MINPTRIGLDPPPATWGDIDCFEKELTDRAIPNRISAKNKQNEIVIGAFFFNSKDSLVRTPSFPVK